MKKLYTEEEHAIRLIKILEKKDGPCSYCPARSTTVDFTARSCGQIDNIWKINRRIRANALDSEYARACYICIGFVGLEYNFSKKCPCFQLGKEEAAKRTWLALEEKGYL